jgi:hypothetical protein
MELEIEPPVLGSGANGGVLALAVSGGTLYAGGDFTMAGGSAANYIARWNGSSWSPLGSGMNTTVYALAVTGSTLYADGTLTTAAATRPMPSRNGTGAVGRLSVRG